MSGAKRLKRQRFFAEHPWCCFCGGGTASATEDHIPARGLFVNRCWPEGYVFPACEPCNHSTSRDELLLAWLVRIRFDDHSAEHEKDFERACWALQAAAPDVWRAIRPHSRVETRGHLRKAGLPNQPFGMDVVHSVGLPAAILDAAARYGEKLAKALHYMHTKRIAPKDAVVKVKVLTNAEVLVAEYLDRFLQVITTEPQIRRATTTLVGQFDYRYVTVEDGAASAFIVSFGHSTVFVLLVFSDRARYEESKARRELEREATA